MARRWALPLAALLLAALCGVERASARSSSGGNGPSLGAATPWSGGDLRSLPRWRAAGAGAGEHSGKCRRTQQGALSTVDERGVLCDLSDVDAASGCCLEGAPSAQRHVCDACDAASKCCREYEACVSCCLGAMDGETGDLQAVSPHHPGMWRRWLIHRDAEAHAAGAAAEAQEGVEEVFSVRPFEYCTHKCRANAHTTDHENMYRSLVHHCYGEKASDDDTAKWHTDELASRKSKHQNAGNADVLARQGGDFLLEQGSLQQLTVPKGPLAIGQMESATQRSSDGGGRSAGGASTAAVNGQRRQAIEKPQGVSKAALNAAQAGVTAGAGGTVRHGYTSSSGGGSGESGSFTDHAYRRMGMHTNRLPMTILAAIFGSLCCLMCCLCVCGEDVAAVLLEM